MKIIMEVVRNSEISKSNNLMKFSVIAENRSSYHLKIHSTSNFCLLRGILEHVKPLTFNGMMAT